MNERSRTGETTIHYKNVETDRDCGLRMKSHLDIECDAMHLQKSIQTWILACTGRKTAEEMRSTERTDTYM